MKQFLLLLLSLAWACAAGAQDTSRQLGYPYEWDDATCQTDFHAYASWFGGWRFDAQTQAFYQSGKGTNWIGSLTTDTFLFPDGEHVACHFEYATAGGAVTLRVLVDYGSGAADTLVTVLPESTSAFARAQFAFTAKGPAVVYFYATLANPLDYGSFYLRRICFRPARPDLVATALLAPAASQVGGGDSVSVSVRYSNPSPFAIERPVLGYDAGQGPVEETYAGTIAPGATLDHTFSTRYVPTAGTKGQLRAWCHAADDGDATNDTLARTLSYYEPLPFPYRTTFDADGDNARWDILSGTWQFGTIAGAGGVVCCSGGGTLLSPAVSLQPGTARVSFYYASANAAGARLRLLMGRGTGPQDLTTVLFDQPVGNSGWLNGYHLLSIDEAGTYYFALQYEQAADLLFVDNFRVDADEDLCMQGVAFDCESGFALSEARVTLSFVNHGVSPQSGIGVRYYVNDRAHYADETVTATVMPGDTLRHTFATPVDISATDSTYTLYGQLLTTVGTDTQNDLVQGQSLTNYRPYDPPYACNFMDGSRYPQWLATPSATGNQWFMANDFYGYDGNIDLMHQNEPAAHHGQSDDWAYSEALHLVPGEYEVAFFHRGRTYFGGPDYVQSFELCLGTDRTPAAMTTTVARYDNHDYRGAMHFERSVGRVAIDSEGLYYLGFHNYSQPNLGETHIDAVTVSAVAPALPLPYTCSFAASVADDWTVYCANSAAAFPKWQLADGAMQVALTGNGYADGPIVSPRLHIEAGRAATVSVDYSLAAEADTAALCVYAATDNTPQAFTLVGTAPPTGVLPAADAADGAPQTADFQTYTCLIEAADAPRQLYIALRSGTDLGATDRLGDRLVLAVRSLSVDYDGADAIADRHGQPDAAAPVYTLAGQRVATGQTAGALRHGLLIQRGRKVIAR